MPVALCIFLYFSFRPQSYNFFCYNPNKPSKFSNLDLLFSSRSFFTSSLPPLFIYTQLAPFFIFFTFHLLLFLPDLYTSLLLFLQSSPFSLLLFSFKTPNYAQKKEQAETYPFYLTSNHFC